jgi:hypothetical protein
MAADEAAAAGDENPHAQIVVAVFSKSMLHVTNGNAFVGTLEASGLPGERLAWDDVLHEGPVPARLSDEELRAERARFLSASGVVGYGEALAHLESRDRRLAEAAGREEIVLWFEADLYDQLQILQILDRLDPDGVELICISDHPSTHRFYGLGQLESHELPPLFQLRDPVTAEQVELARHGWMALREPTPESLDLLRTDAACALPFLNDALTRLLEELPWTTDGLSRTDRSFLESLDRGPLGFPELFRAHMAAEERPFLGDTYALEHLRALAAAQPLVHEAARWFELTEDGCAVLAGGLDAIELRGIDRWLGGTHLKLPDAVWRWDPGAGAVVGP